MDNKKIGKLIADLRNAKGMTQQELGDKVGVGFRAVSKWERGLTLPDIAIINELSNILGITSDELLSGEIKKNKNKANPKLKVLIISILTLITISIIIFGIAFFTKSKTYIYNIECIESDKYYIEGQLSFQNNKISIIVNKLRFKDDEFSSQTIQDYSYDIYINNELIFGYGYHPSGKYSKNGDTISDLFETFRINYNGITHISQKEFVNNNIELVINFIDKDNNSFSKEIELYLVEQN